MSQLEVGFRLQHRKGESDGKGTMSKHIVLCGETFASEPGFFFPVLNTLTGGGTSWLPQMM